MKRIFLDTNFIADYLLREEYKAICQEFLAEGARKKIKFYVSFLSIANFAYIARRLPKELLYRYLKVIGELFDIVDNNKNQVTKALELGAPDFEDALQYCCAKDAGCDCIITRNQKDFTFSDIPVLSASEYLENYN